MVKKIGVYIVPQDEIIKVTYEVAAWYRLIAIKAGEYPVLEYQSDYGQTYIYTKLGGTYVEEYLPSLFGGVCVGGPYDRYARAGQDANHEKFFSRESLKNDSRVFLDKEV